MDLPSPERADVVLRVPAEGAYVSVLRTMTAGLAARLDYTVDDIEDLRIAVGEACAIVLPEATAGGDLEAEFRLSPGALTVSVSVPTEGAQAPDQDSFAWQVLTTLSTSSHAAAEDHRYEITFVAESSVPTSEGRPGTIG
jgi:serine/threonine-protein kinase RsbW